MKIVIDLLTVAAVACSGLGAYFWIRRNVWTSASSIADLARQKWDYNETVANELCGQKADSLVAWVYICSATIAQTVPFFIPPAIDSYAPLNIRHFFYLVTISVVLYFIGNFASRKLEKVLIHKAKALLNSKASEHQPD